MSGFIDLQVNGYLGVDFRTPELTLDQIDLASQTLFERGTAGYLAVVVTTNRETYQKVLPTLAQAMKRGASRNRLLGIHLEGPFISNQPGAVGAHPQECVADCDPEYLDALIDWSEGAVRVITIAPERPGALELIRHARSRGLIVSLGHSHATCDQVEAAVLAGAQLATHTGNGIAQLVPRQDNPIIGCMANPDLTAMIITDGHHLIDPFIKAVLYSKRNSKIIVTSDSAPPAGLPPGDYVCFGSPARLEPNGYLRNLAAPGLAGSGSNLFECMNHLASVLASLPSVPWSYEPEIRINESLDINNLNETHAERCAAALWTWGRGNPAAILGIDPNTLDDPGVQFDAESFQFMMSANT